MHSIKYVYVSELLSQVPIILVTQDGVVHHVSRPCKHTDILKCKFIFEHNI